MPGWPAIPSATTILAIGCLLLLGKLTGNLPEIAYNVGQASWYGLLLIGSFGVVYNLLAWRRCALPTRGGSARPVGWSTGGAAWLPLPETFRLLSNGSMPTASILPRLIAWTDVHNFPENASQSPAKWYIGIDWWWWRTSRVIEDVDLLGNHIEVIDEFPAFSYVLGDNHPHVMAMPMVLLAIGLILNMFYQRHVASAPAASDDEAGESDGRSWMKRLAIVMPLGWAGLLLITIVVGSLIFLNTWDFPPYWLLFVVAALYVAARRAGATGHTGSVWRDSVLVAVAVGAVVLIGTIIIYLPYFLSAQSQAGGIVPNFFHPTRLPQFLLMFGSFLPALIALSILGWRQQRPSSGRIVLGAVVVFGLPLLFLCLSLLLAGSSGIGRDVSGERRSSAWRRKPRRRCPGALAQQSVDISPDRFDAGAVRCSAVATSGRWDTWRGGRRSVRYVCAAFGSPRAIARLCAGIRLFARQLRHENEYGL